MDGFIVPSWEQIARIAPVTILVIGIASITYYAVKKLTDEHIKSLKEFIEYLKEVK